MPGPQDSLQAGAKCHRFLQLHFYSILFEYLNTTRLRLALEKTLSKKNLFTFYINFFDLSFWLLRSVFEARYSAIKATLRSHGNYLLSGLKVVPFQQIRRFQKPLSQFKVLFFGSIRFYAGPQAVSVQHV